MKKAITIFFNLAIIALTHSQTLEYPKKNCNGATARPDDLHSWCQDSVDDYYDECECNFEKAIKQYKRAVKKITSQIDQLSDKKEALEKQVNELTRDAEKISNSLYDGTSTNFNQDKTKVISYYQNVIEKKRKVLSLLEEICELNSKIEPKRNCNQNSSSITDIERKIYEIEELQPKKQIKLSVRHENESKEYTKNDTQLSNESIYQKRQREASEEQKQSEYDKQRAEALAQMKKDYIQEQKRKLASSTAMSQISSGNYQGAAYTFANAGMMNEAWTSFGIGMVSGIISAINDDRQRKIKSYSEIVKEKLKTLPRKDEKARSLFNEKKYEDYIEEEKKLREAEDYILQHADWIFEKTSNSSIGGITREIRDRQFKRLGALSFAFNAVIEGSNLKNIDLIRKIRDFEEREVEIIISSNSKKVREQIYNNRILRDKKLLVENLENKKHFTTNFFENAYYLRSDFEDSFFNKEALNYFKNSNFKTRRFLTSWAIHNYSRYTNSQNLNKLILLLDDGDCLNYYMNLNEKEDRKEKPLYKHVRKFYNKKANKLIKSFIKKDKKIADKSLKELYNERKYCATPNCTLKKQKKQQIIDNHDFSEGYAIYLEDGAYSFIDETGKQVSSKKYDDVNPYTGDYAAVFLNGKVGVIDKKGKEIIKTRYDGFSNLKYLEYYGVVMAVLNKKQGLINRKGYEITPFIYDKVKVKVNYSIASINNLFGIINNETGKQLTPIKYNSIRTMGNGFFIVEVDKKLGLVNREGKEITPIKYERIGIPLTQDEFSEGLVAFEVNKKWGVLNQSGDEAIEAKYKHVGDFKGGLAKVTYQGERDKRKPWIITNANWGFINKKMKEVIPCSYGYANNYSDGLALVGKNGKLGYIDKTNIIKIPLIYNLARNFSFGLAAIKKGEKYGYINTKGDLVIPTEYDYAAPFYEEYAVVEKNGKFGFIDKNGNIKIDIKFDDASAFIDGLALVGLNGKKGFIDKNGKEIIPIIYDLAFRFHEGLSYVRLNGKQGKINKSNEVVVPFQEIKKRKK